MHLIKLRLWWNMFIHAKGPQKAKRWGEKSPVAEWRGHSHSSPFSWSLPSVIRNAWIGPTFTHLQFSQPIRMESFPKFQFSPVQSIGGAAFFYAAAKSLQSCPTLLRPHRRQPTRLPCPWDSPGKNTGVGCHFLLQCMKVKSEREVAQSCPTLSDPMDCSPPGSSIHGIFQARVLEWGAIAFSGILL